MPVRAENPKTALYSNSSTVYMSNLKRTLKSTFFSRGTLKTADSGGAAAAEGI